MTHFSLLSEPQNYVPHNWDLLSDSDSRAYWLEHFDKHFTQVASHAVACYGRKAGKDIAAAQGEFSATIAALRDKPDSLPGGKLSVVELCRFREGILRKHKIGDPYGNLKRRENESAIKLYPQVVRKIHSLNGSDKWLRTVQCVFAGNIFDMGASSTMLMTNQSGDFLATVEKGQPRPWLVDDFDKLAADLPAHPPMKWGKAVIFLDNAGTDFILGVMPLARELALAGTKIVLAANELPALNDMTVDETVSVVQRLAAMDDDLAALIEAGMFEVVSSGNDIPLIDLSNVSDELNEAAQDAELIVLVGMGRGIETNYSTPFKADALRLAILKEKIVAERLGGEVFDCVCKYSPASS